MIRETFHSAEFTFCKLFIFVDHGFMIMITIIGFFQNYQSIEIMICLNNSDEHHMDMINLVISCNIRKR